MSDVLLPLAPLVPSFRNRSECVPFHLIPSVDLTRVCYTGLSVPRVRVLPTRNFLRPVRVRHLSQFHRERKLTQIYFLSFRDNVQA